MERLPPGLLAALALALLLASTLAAVGGPGPAAGGPVGAASAPPPPGPLDASVGIAMTAAPPMPGPRGLVVFTVYYNNTGNASAALVWINDTMPSGLVFVSDTVSGSSTAFPRYTLTAVAPGAHSFTLTARVGIGVVPGSTLTNAAALAYANGTGAVRTAGPASASVIAGLGAKQLHLVTSLGLNPRLTPTAPSGGLLLANEVFLKKGGLAATFDLSPVLARAFNVTQPTAYLYLDSASGQSESLNVNVTVGDWNGATLVQIAAQQQTVTTDNAVGMQRFAFALRPLGWTMSSGYTFPAGHAIRLRASVTDASSDDGLLATNASTADSQLAVLTSTYVSVDAIPLRDGKGPASVWSPKDSLVIRANVSDPLGSYDVAGARLNVTAPNGSLVVAGSSMTLLQTDAANPSAWKLFTSTLSPLLQNGTYGIEVDGVEGNGVVDAALASATVRAPSFTLQKVASVVQAKGGVRFTYTIWFNDTGTGPAGRVWINDTMPSQLTFVSSPNATAVPNTPIWTLAPVSVGSHWISFDVRVQGGTSAAYVRNWVSLNYTDEKGYLWPMSMAHADVVINGPAVALAVAATPSPLLHRNQSVAYTITLTNQGDAAQTLWLNDTLPAGLTYVADTHNPAWGTVAVTGSAVAFTFGNMASGATWSFTLTARAGPGLARGAVLVNALALNTTSVNGVLMPPTSAAVSSTIAAPWVSSASLAFAVPGATPGDVLLLRVNVTNEGNEPASAAWINLTLDPSLTFVDASVAATVAGSSVRLMASAVPIGASTIFVNVSVAGNVTDSQALAAAGTLAYADGFGNPLPSLTLTPASVRVGLPRLSVAAIPANLALEAATNTTIRLVLANSGTGVAGDVWLNLSLPGEFLFLSDTSDGMRSVVGAAYSWHWSALDPGSKAFDLRLEASPSAADRSSADLVFAVAATDANGNLQPAQPKATVHASFVAPSVTLSLQEDRDTSLAGGTFAYTIVVRNAGSTAAAYVNVTDTLDARLQYLSDNATVPVAGTRVLSWNFTGLQPGGQVTFTVRVRVADGVAAQSYIPNTAEARYANSRGTPVGYARSGAAYLRVIADALPLVYIVVGGLAAGAAAVVLVYRRNAVQIEEVFLVYRDGVLLSHLSRTMVQDKDRDVLSGMLVAVQDFVKDAFTYGEHRELHQMEFGDYHIQIERGAHAYLAVVYRGRDSGAIRRKVRRSLDRVEAAYGGVLASWQGDMDQVVGARDILRDNLLGRRFLGLLPRPA